jgi:23S rRNA (adenine2503-C2)-methyltransferase
MKKLIEDYNIEELKKKMIEMGEKPHRAGQIFQWIYRKKADDFSLMTDLPKNLISKLNENFRAKALKLKMVKESRDSTKKYLWLLRDGEYIESVLIKDRARRTLCVSSQVGCKVGCPFCASGKYGFKRDLSAGEIVGQVLSVERTERIRITNVVYMGMGEPLDNFDNVIKSVRIINAAEALGIGARKITISTCGFIPEIKKLRETGIQLELSISLHAVNDSLRDKLVPVNKKYPLKDIMKTCLDYYKYTGRVVTLEYTLISGVNDSMEEAEKLSRITKKIKAKVNLLACNVSPGGRIKRVSEKKIRDFRRKLVDSGVTATYRRPRGGDILAACGQLAGRGKKGLR